MIAPLHWPSKPMLRRARPSGCTSSASADGRQVAAGRTPVPASGTPLLLIVPASTLSSPGQYVLSLRDREAASFVADYRFEVAAIR